MISFHHVVGCEFFQYQCDNGQCISSSFATCDGTQDCSDGSDEEGCGKYMYPPLLYVYIQACLNEFVWRG